MRTFQVFPGRFLFSPAVGVVLFYEVPTRRPPASRRNLALAVNFSIWQRGARVRLPTRCGAPLGALPLRGLRRACGAPWREKRAAAPLTLPIA